MPVSDPYRPPESKAAIASSAVKPRSKGLWALIGFGISVALPIGAGVYSIYQFNVYVATLPPGTAVCGNPVLGAYVLILIGGPFCGFLGAASGWAAAMINWRVSY